MLGDAQYLIATVPRQVQTDDGRAPGGHVEGHAGAVLAEHRLD